MNLYAEVALSLPLKQTFFYSVPELYQEKAKVGMRVLVPLHQRLITGFIVKLRKKKTNREYKLKEIHEVLDERPVFSSSFLSFTRKLSDYYYSSWGEMLQASLPPSFVLKSKTRIVLAEEGKAALRDRNLSREEREFLAVLQKSSYSTLFLKRKFKEKNFSLLLSRLEKKGFIHHKREITQVRQRTKMESGVSPIQLEMDFSLDRDSQRAADQVVQKIERQAFSPFYLYGSSAKRELVYFYLIKKILAQERRVLFLVPEIILTQSLKEKFEKRLGEKVALLHSRLSERRREQEWQKIKEGGADVVVGPRSALFSPFDHLGLIIVDEEQDESYFQKESPHFDARKGAWLRAKQEDVVLVYGSAHPSIEGFFKAKKRGYLLLLEHEEGRKKAKIVDDRRERSLISQKLKERIEDRLKKGERILVFCNRRGYASFLCCSRCNYIPRCTRCDIALNYHKREEQLICHYCNYSLPKQNDCPECGKRMMRKGSVGIEAVEEELRKIFPLSRIASFDADRTKRRKEQERILNSFRNGRIDILMGTQLLAHQVGLPVVSLVGILYPEVILALSDYRASQRAFQAINQMMKFLSKDSTSEVVIQTALPHHFSILQAVSDDYFSFYSQEIKFRRLMSYPPFSKMVEILFQGENLRSLARKTREFTAQVKNGEEDVEVLGPAMASVSRVRGINRVQVILKTQTKKSLDDVLRKSLKAATLKKSVLVYE